MYYVSKLWTLTTSEIMVAMMLVKLKYLYSMRPMRYQLLASQAVRK